MDEISKVTTEQAMMSGWRDRGGCNGMPGHTRLVEFVVVVVEAVELELPAEAILSLQLGRFPASPATARMARRWKPPRVPGWACVVPLSQGR